jgi:hypothetical protein
MPHVITLQAIEHVAAFAEAELGALVLHGGVGLNTGLPLTDNQKARQHQIKETEKKRAAALRQTAAQPTQQAPTTGNAAAVRCSSTTSSWASPCRSWTERGVCQRGISCHFAHPGFPVTEDRCITCGAKDHRGKDCKAPGGGADPNREAAWEEYRKRKEQAAAAGKAGAKGRGKGHPKGGKGKDKDKDKGKANAAISAEQPAGAPPATSAQAKAAFDGESLRASSATTTARFPRQAVGLDS